MKKTIIFGGAFNPPTVAHEIMLKTCVDYARKLKADLWVMPSGNRFDKNIFSDRDTRVNYISAMIADVDTDGVIVDIITNELDREKTIETFDTVQELTQQYPDRSFIWVFGADSIDTMPNWKKGEWLLENLDMLVFRRPGCVIKSLAKNIKILDIVTPDVSSTELRRRINAGESIDDMVGKTVRSILLNQK